MDKIDITIMQDVVDFFEEFESFFETAKSELKPILDAVWEHYELSDKDDQVAHNLMLEMAMKHDHGRNWTLFDTANALQYAKLYMVDAESGGSNGIY